MEDYWGQPQDRGFSVRLAKPKTDKKLLGSLAAKFASLESEPWGDEQHYHFAALSFGNALVALQPPRGYGVDPDAIYHTPDLPPTHHYAAFYRWLAAPQSQGGWGADAIVHLGKHGTLEWLPGKGIGLSGECFPDLLLGDMPLIYPFIINDPGEGSQSKRRAHAVIVDHLTPPMTSAETYGALAELNQLVNEYYAVEKLDPSKLPYLQQQIWDLVQKTNLQADLDLKSMLSRDHGDHKHEWDDELTPEGIPATLAEMSGNEVAHLIEDLDGYLCELGMAQIRSGLHVLGQMPPLAEMLRSLTRLSNEGIPSLQASLATAFGFELARLLQKPGERLQEDRIVFGADLSHPCRCTGNTRPRSIRPLHHAGDAGLSHRERSQEYNAQCSAWSLRKWRRCWRLPVPGLFPSSSRRAMRSRLYSTRSKESMYLLGRLVRLLAAWPTFCRPVETSMPSTRERSLPRRPGASASNSRARPSNASAGKKVFTRK